ncbi:hypothetical protein G8A07_16340 [Roseateles sp. DAIF2]|uniref:hypothetical protein n=1 Tax=Roseateles sp. DAIF2 TaxID=2714952 RepID=UPI0018A30F69|nr:hypothetical protein [Roseateles sp. DAIF2]QPF74338.1 hypothetical protein G8A07_16340 [Roseateles sp. DAIF2]
MSSIPHFIAQSRHYLLAGNHNAALDMPKLESWGHAAVLAAFCLLALAALSGG